MLTGIRERVWLGLLAVLLVGCAPQSADRTPGGVITGEGGQGSRLTFDPPR